MRRGPSLSGRASVGAVLAWCVGCSPLIVLGDADNAGCIDTGCGGTAESGSGGLGGTAPDLAGGQGGAVQPVTPSGGCKESSVQGTSYMACLAAADFDQAEASCQANGMHLVKIDSALENMAVVSLALDDYVWVGGSNRDDPNAFIWLDGTPFYVSGAAVGDTYQNFGSGEPATDPKLRCLQLRRTSSGTWSNWQCTGMQSFVCERY